MQTRNAPRYSPPPYSPRVKAAELDGPMQEGALFCQITNPTRTELARGESKTLAAQGKSI